MSTLLLRGGGTIEDVHVGLDSIKRAREEGYEWLSVTWQPGYTPQNPDSFRVEVLTEEVIGVRTSGR